MTDYEPDAPLPGLEPSPPSAGEVEVAARRTLRALADGLDEHQALPAQALVTVARQLDRAASSAKAKDYAVANLVAQLRENYLLLVPTSGGDEQDAWSELVGQFRDAWSGADLRDPTQPGTAV